MHWYASVVALLPLLLTALAAECPGKENTNLPWSGTPTLLQKVANGSLFTAGDGEDQLYVLHVYGSPYSMGYAHGTLLKDKVQYLMTAFYKHVETEIEEYIKDLPKDVQDFIAAVGLDVVLELTYLLTRDYTPAYFFEELHGLSDASGVDYNLLLKIHMLPELVKAGCSMLGSWGKSAVKPTMMTQLRALDWDATGPLQNVPVVTVYHPNQGNDFANVGWAGWIATIAGVSAKGIAISEKHSDEKFGEESRSGIPFNILMKDVVQFDDSLNDAMKRIMDAHRTCSIWLGVGDGKMQSFRLVAYSESTADFYDDQNVTKINASRFEREGCSQSCYQNYTLTDLVYWGVRLQCWQESLHQYYGQLDPAMVMRLGGLVQTGNLQSVVYDLAEMQVYVSNARGDKEQGPDNAYDRQFVQLDLMDLFKQPKPTL